MRRRGLAPAPQPPTDLERTTEREGWRLIGPALSRALSAIFPEVLAMAVDLRARQDRATATDADDLGGPFRRARLIAERLLTGPEVEAMAERAARRGGKYADATLGTQIKALVGVDPLASQPELLGVVRERARAHSALIKTVPARFFRDIERQVVDVVRSGTLTRDLELELRERFYSGEPLAKARRYAKRLARDQVGKTVAAVSEARQTKLGIRRYRWRTAKDERVRGNPSGRYPNARPSHFAREGVVFDWSKPPEGGHPGQAIQCRCYPEPVIDEETEDQIKGAGAAPRPRPQLELAPRAAPIELKPQRTRETVRRARQIERATTAEEGRQRDAEMAALAQVAPSVAQAWRATARYQEAANRLEAAAFKLAEAKRRTADAGEALARTRKARQTAEREVARARAKREALGRAMVRR